MTNRRLPGILLVGALAACARTPITVPAAYAPPYRPVEVSQPSSRPLVDVGPQCAVRLADVRDVRDDPTSLGMMEMRAVHAADSVAWLQSALATLKQDRRLRFADDDKGVQLVVRVELVKAYILNITEAKSSNVVVRIRYGRDGEASDTQIERGRDTGINWAGGEEETQGSLNRALAQAMIAVADDIVAHCRAAAAVKASN